MLSKNRTKKTSTQPVYSNTVFGNHLSKHVRIQNEHGLHARPAAKIVSIAQNARSNVWIIKGNQKADAKSMIDLLILGCQKGSTVTVMVEDIPDLNVLNDIVDMFESCHAE